MANDLNWAHERRLDSDFDRLRTFADLTAPLVSHPTENHLQDFASVIENVIVPRLLMTHVCREEPDQENPISEGMISEFIALTINENPEAAVDFVGELLDKGVPFQKVLLELMAPAARELGIRWVHDSTSFVEVTLGVARMHRILREFDGVPDHMWSDTGHGLHTLLLPTPGENHTFGLRLVQEFLLRESWTVTNHPVEALGDLKAVVSEQHFDVIGLSLSGETLIDSLVSAIHCIRSHSRNRHVKIIVGGHVFAVRPELVKICGADAFGSDAPSSVAIVNGWARELAAIA